MVGIIKRPEWEIVFTDGEVVRGPSTETITGFDVFRNISSTFPIKDAIHGTLINHVFNKNISTFKIKNRDSWFTMPINGNNMIFCVQRNSMRQDRAYYFFGVYPDIVQVVAHGTD